MQARRPVALRSRPARLRRARSQAAREPDVIAGVDLGSNSFHMIVARVVDGRLHVIDRMREVVRLAAGLNQKRELTKPAKARAVACLKRFGQRLRGMPARNVRAVGTNTFRRARNTRRFLVQCERALGHDIEVLPGREEARLIYLGVAHELPDDAGRRLVVDIGGGSTECIIGEHFEPVQADSLFMGCVGYSLQHFPGGRVRARGMEKAEIAARLELQSIERRYRAIGWTECVGSSGTALHVDAILRANDFSRDGITLKGLTRLRKALLSAGDVRSLRLRGLQADRLAVLPGGLAIMIAIFEGLRIQRMHASSGALREGLLYELAGRKRHEDIRDQTIRRIAEHYHVDLEQAARVERAALRCLEQVADDWQIDRETGEQFLSWAARLHEIGLSVAYAGYHKHSAYLVTHSDMPGFSRDDQQVLAAVILGHRRKVPSGILEGLPPEHVGAAWRLCIILRLAVCLNRSRSQAPLPRFRLRARGNALHVAFARRWLEQHPLTKADLGEEAARLAEVGFRLVVR
ncbi:MAG TPA: Ppx/GppA phosphatase family protein [Candidatus Binatia bacterium]|nr:Ppx/GppA phosphatase family protein [Candidatus Binatia bacterium]